LFNAYEFTFAGQSSLSYDLMIYDIDGHSQDTVSFGNKADIIEGTTLTRVRPLHYGVNYNSSPLEFKLVFGSDRPFDRYEMEDIALWLTGYQDYQWLSIGQADLEGREFRCMVTELTPIVISWLPVAFEATIRCDCPYAYGLPYHYQYSVSDSSKVIFRNNGSVREYIKPMLTITLVDNATDFSIINESDNGREIKFTNLPASVKKIILDNERGILVDVETGLNLYPYFNKRFFRAVQGDNILQISGSATVEFDGRFLHNTAG
jgi:phage-related protein